nr:5005_t:CDS:1 [Entrophospora candida]
MAKFNPHFSKFLDQLPPSIKNDIWKRLTTRLHNPLTEEEACGIHPDVEALLIRGVDSYAKKKGHQRLKVLTNATPESSTALSQLDELKKRLSIREAQLDQKEHDIENVISTRLNDEYNRLRAEYDHCTSEYDTTVYALKQKLEEKYQTQLTAMEKALIDKDKVHEQVLHSKNSKIADLSALLKDIKKSLNALKKQHASTLSALQKLEAKNRELLEVIDAKDQKIINLNDRIISYNPRGCGDGAVEPESYYTTIDRDLWMKWRNDAKYDLEIRKKFAFRFRP